MAITGKSIASVTEDSATEESIGALNAAVASLRKRLAMEQDQQVDADDIETEDIILNTERMS